MLIILEGPDCAGKTTLLRQIQAKLRAIVPQTDTITMFHSSAPRCSEPLSDYVDQLLSYKPGTGHHILCDRWHWGERVYPTILDRLSNFDGPRWRYTEAFLTARGGFTALVTASVFTLTNRIRSRGDDLIGVKDVDRLQKMFLNVSDDSTMPNTTVNVEDEPNVVERIVSMAKINEQQAVRLNDFTTYVGTTHRPHILLVGDKRGGTPQPRETAFMPYNATSGHYLWKALASENHHVYMSAQLGVMNACDVDDIRLAVDMLRPWIVVALGNNASNELMKNGIHHEKSPHPQWVRRFHHGKLHQYRDELLQGKDVTWN